MTRAVLPLLMVAAIAAALTLPAPADAAVKCRPVNVRSGRFEGGATHIWATRTNCRVARAVARWFVCWDHAPREWSVVFLLDYWPTAEMRDGRRVVRFRPVGGAGICKLR